MTEAGIRHRREAAIPVVFKGKKLDKGFRADIVAEDKVIIEVKEISALTPIDDAQILTYLRMSGIRVGLLMNFHSLRLIDGLRRFIV